MFLNSLSPALIIFCYVFFSGSTILSAALILDSVCRSWFIIESHTSNPFKLVAKVLNYARQNKYPHCMSASTYDGHTKPSRMWRQTLEVLSVWKRLKMSKHFWELFLLHPIGGTVVLDTIMGQTVTIFPKHVIPGDLPCYGYQAFTMYSTPFLVVCIVPLQSTQSCATTSLLCWLILE